MTKLVVDRLKSASNDAAAKPAVLCGERCLSYAELDALSDNIAAGLQSTGVSTHERIGIYMHKSVEAIACIYGTLKAGCSYVPIALEYPLPRIAYMLENCGIRFVLVATAPAPEVGHGIRTAGANVLVMEDLISAIGPGRNLLKPAHPSPQDAAAILYTSGSTGNPKGAVITHANLAAFVSWALPAFNLVPNDRLLSHAPLQFDLSFFDVFASAAASAAIVLASPADTANAARMSHLVNQSGVSIWQSVPSALTLQALSGRQQLDPMPGIRCVLFAGERLPRRTLLTLPKAFPNARLYNIYGCTETNNSFMYLLPQDVAQAPDPLPIGKALPYIRYRIVDDSGGDVGPGQEGHLLVSGETNMAGYIGLVPNDNSNDGFYRTKDIVSVGEDGDLRFHARVDAVIKTNGYRVNLMEIEDHLRRSRKLEEVALFSVPDDLIGNRIIAAVRPRAGETCSSLDLKLYCAEALPRYAIPHYFHINREELPKGNTGKVDKRLLAQVWQQVSASRSTVAGDVNHEYK